jgi:hypothetical protein
MTQRIPPASLTAFCNDSVLASGPAIRVALAVKRAEARADLAAILCFDDRTGQVVDLDLRGTDAEIAARLTPLPAEPKPTTPARVGRPRLGVVAKEVTLLPRHWDWLGQQSGSASATLRKLVEAARNSAGPEVFTRAQAQEAADRFMLATLGNHPGYEDAARALYAGDGATFQNLIKDWPKDLRDYAHRLAAPAFEKDFS